MLVYQGIKESFIDDVDTLQIANRIKEKYIQFLHRKPTDAEFRSWKNSMQYMRSVLSDKEIPDNSGVAIEYNIPPTGSRIDFLMTGYGDNNKHEAIIIELKQWEKCKEAPMLDGIYKVNTYTGGGMRDVNHPSYQALTYANLIRDYNSSVEKNEIEVKPCAFLHNYYFDENDSLLKEQYQEYVDEAPLFGAEDVLKLRGFIKRYIKTGDDKTILYEIDSGKIKPSKMLQDSLSSMLDGNEEFQMIDSQNIIYQYALRNATEAIKTGKKHVMIVHGGPGTGKSVLAINLLVELNKRGKTCFYVTKNAEPREVFAIKLRGKYTKEYINHLFQSSGRFVDKPSDEIDCLVVDEAHRLNEKSNFFGKGDNQVKEIINASKFSIFFLDEDQRVTLKDIGSEKLIKKYADEFGAKTSVYELDSQFRCNGSDGYIAWLNNVLEIKQTANFDLNGFNYDFRVFDNPNELRTEIEHKNAENNKSRIVAGYCWNWPKESKKNPDFNDIVIPEYDFEISWNLDDGEKFAIGQDTVKQAGCIHTVQGLEFDYVGVIIGDDMRFDDGIVTDYKARAKTDKTLVGLGKYQEDEKKKVADKIIKNTYKTLMTRGMKGCYVFCTDKKLAAHLRNSVGNIGYNFEDVVFDEIKVADVKQK